MAVQEHGICFSTSEMLQRYPYKFIHTTWWSRVCGVQMQAWVAFDGITIAFSHQQQNLSSLLSSMNTSVSIALKDIPVDIEEAVNLPHGSIVYRYL